MACRYHFELKGGTGPQPYQNVSYSGAISSDHISSSHTLEFCQPIPGQNFNVAQDAPPRNNCGNYSRDLASYPLNNPTITSGNMMTFGASEMVLVFLQLNNYPGSGYINITFYRADGSVMFTQSISVPAPDPNWDWWYYFGWACVGKFDSSSGFSGNEILTSGHYNVKVETSWGMATIGYDVADSSPAPPMNVTFEVAGPGTFLIYKNGNLAATALPNNPKTVSFQIGDKFGYQAIADATATFQSLCDVPQTECRPEPQYTYDIVGQIPGRFIATFTTVPPTKYSCLNDCSTAVYVGDYDSKAACLTGCAPPPPPCSSIPVDSWSVSKALAIPGEAIKFTLRTAEPNKPFMLKDETNPIFHNQILKSQTDASGCYEGSIPPMVTGTYVFNMYLLDLITDRSIGIRQIRWGTEEQQPIDLVGLLKYAPLALGLMVAANIIGALRGR